jgi:predicted RNA-binding Zn-ribbon protein involved in translation (DUF1610 family)
MNGAHVGDLAACLRPAGWLRRCRIQRRRDRGHRLAGRRLRLGVSSCLEEMVNDRLRGRAEHVRTGRTPCRVSKPNPGFLNALTSQLALPSSHYAVGFKGKAFHGKFFMHQRRGRALIALLGVLTFFALLTLIVQILRDRRLVAKESSPAPTKNRRTAKATSAPILFFACISCGKNLKVKAELAGKKVKCPQCGKPVLVGR